MKKIFFWLVLIGSILVILGSCAKDENEETTSSCATDTTASGSITVGSETMSGVYLSNCTFLLKSVLSEDLCRSSLISCEKPPLILQSQTPSK